jgi:hypothetical protein
MDEESDGFNCELIIFTWLLKKMLLAKAAYRQRTRLHVREPLIHYRWWPAGATCGIHCSPNDFRHFFWPTTYAQKSEGAIVWMPSANSQISGRKSRVRNRAINRTAMACIPCLSVGLWKLAGAQTFLFFNRGSLFRRPIFREKSGLVVNQNQEMMNVQYFWVGCGEQFVLFSLTSGASGNQPSIMTLHAASISLHHYY